MKSHTKFFLNEQSFFCEKKKIQFCCCCKLHKLLLKFELITETLKPFQKYPIYSLSVNKFGKSIQLFVFRG